MKQKASRRLDRETTMPFIKCKRLPECSRCGNIWIPEDHSLLDAPESVMAKEIKRCGRCKSTAWNSTTAPRPRKKKSSTQKTGTAPKKAAHTRGDGRDSRRKSRELDYAEINESAPCEPEVISSLVETEAAEPANQPAPLTRCKHRLLYCTLCRPVSQGTHDTASA